MLILAAVRRRPSQPLGSWQGAESLSLAQFLMGLLGRRVMVSWVWGQDKDCSSRPYPQLPTRHWSQLSTPLSLLFFLPLLPSFFPSTGPLVALGQTWGVSQT